MTQYILYCAQEANFQTRSMLIPYELIMQCELRSKQLQFLRKHALKNVIFKSYGKNYLVDQLLINNINWDNDVGKYEEDFLSDIISDFTNYADGYHKDYDMESNKFIIIPFKEKDEIWISDIINSVTSEGDNHVVNYCRFRNKTNYKGKNIEIIEGFLSLESHNEKLRVPHSTAINI